MNPLRPPRARLSQYSIGLVERLNYVSRILLKQVLPMNGKAKATSMRNPSWHLQKTCSRADGSPRRGMLIFNLDTADRYDRQRRKYISMFQKIKNFLTIVNARLMKVIFPGYEGY